MKKINKNSKVTILVVSLVLILAGPIGALAATTPSLGVAAPFGVLGSTYTNTTASAINGDLGYTTPPAVAATVSGTTHVADGSFNQAGIDQAGALSVLNAQVCDFNFGSATDLSLLFQPLTPGVYCIVGAASIGTGGITLTGSGTYVFRSTGALNTVANSIITLSPGVSACDVFWTPTATTLGANSTFAGTDIDASGITVGSTVLWAGRALAFGGTVTTDTDTINVPACTATSSLATLHIIKLVVNSAGGVAVPSDFLLHIKSATSSVDVLGSPSVGTSTPGTLYSLSVGAYVVSENANASYVQTFSGDCDSSGVVTLSANDNKICTVINTYIAPPAPVVLPISGGGNGPIAGSLPVAFNAPAQVLVTSTSSVAPVGAVLGASTSSSVSVSVPGFPNTGFPPEAKGAPRNIIMLAGAIVLALASLVVVPRLRRGFGGQVRKRIM